ncbi:uncharacterized protein LOC135397324 isoform X2 [Ornithodoros turicata]|uniref:uncharacterized protein LOC135397324 isoform X2 n=1 Tax=Ornithodoros turicata TaxID=34597 RepID=UPI00313A2F15
MKKLVAMAASLLFVTIGLVGIMYYIYFVENEPETAVTWTAKATKVRRAHEGNPGLVSPSYPGTQHSPRHEPSSTFSENFRKTSSPLTLQTETEYLNETTYVDQTFWVPGSTTGARSMSRPTIKSRELSHDATIDKNQSNAVTSTGSKTIEVTSPNATYVQDIDNFTDNALPRNSRMLNYVPGTNVFVKHWSHKNTTAAGRTKQHGFTADITGIKFKAYSLNASNLDALMRNKSNAREDTEKVVANISGYPEHLLGSRRKITLKHYFITITNGPTNGNSGEASTEDIKEVDIATYTERSIQAGDLFSTAITTTNRDVLTTTKRTGGAAYRTSEDVQGDTVEDTGTLEADTSHVLRTVRHDDFSDTTNTATEEIDTTVVAKSSSTSSDKAQDPLHGTSSQINQNVLTTADSEKNTFEGATFWVPEDLTDTLTKGAGMAMSTNTTSVKADYLSGISSSPMDRNVLTPGDQEKSMPVEVTTLVMEEAAPNRSKKTTTTEFIERARRAQDGTVDIRHITSQWTSSTPRAGKVMVSSSVGATTTEHKSTPSGLPVLATTGAETSPPQERLLLCTLGGKIPEAHFPKDGLCDFLFYTHVFLDLSRLDVVSTSDDDSFTHFKRMAARRGKRTSFAFSFHIDFVMNVALNSGNFSRSEYITHHGILNVIGDSNQIDRYVDNIRTVLPVLRNLQKQPKNPVAIAVGVLKKVDLPQLPRLIKDIVKAGADIVVVRTHVSHWNVNESMATVGATSWKNSWMAEHPSMLDTLELLVSLVPIPAVLMMSFTMGVALFEMPPSWKNETSRNVVHYKPTSFALVSYSQVYPTVGPNPYTMLQEAFTIKGDR